MDSSATAWKRAATVVVKPEHLLVAMMVSLVQSIPATKQRTPVTILLATLCVITTCGATELKPVRLPTAVCPGPPLTATTASGALPMSVMNQQTRASILPIMLRAPTICSVTDQRFAIQRMTAKPDPTPAPQETFVTRLTMSVLNVMPIVTVTMASSATAWKHAATVVVKPEHLLVAMMVSLVQSIPATKQRTPVTILLATLCVITTCGATELKPVRLPTAVCPGPPLTATTASGALPMSVMNQQTRASILPIMLRAPTICSVTDQRFAIQRMTAKPDPTPAP